MEKLTFHIYYPGRKAEAILPVQGTIVYDLSIELSKEDIIELKKFHAEILDIPVLCIETEAEHNQKILEETKCLEIND